MPQKLNKAGQMQDYIPKGNGDASGEYGTSKGTNKNFTASDKKSSKANVITENKSVVVGDKKETKKEKEKPFDIDTLDVSLRKQVESGKITLKEASRELAKAGWYNFVPSEEETRKTLGLKDNKANIINDDLSGNVDKEGYINKEIAELLGQNEKQVKDQIHRLHFMSGGDKMETAKTYYEMALQSKYGLPKYREIVEDKHNKEWYEKADDNYAKAEQHLHSKAIDYENQPEIKAIYEKMGKDILRERKLIYDKLKEFDK